MIHLVFATATSLFFSLLCFRLFGIATTATFFFYMFFFLVMFMVTFTAATAAFFVIVMGHDFSPLVVEVDENLGIKDGTWAA